MTQRIVRGDGRQALNEQNLHYEKIFYHPDLSATFGGYNVGPRIGQKPQTQGSDCIGPEQP